MTPVGSLVTTTPNASAPAAPALAPEAVLKALARLAANTPAATDAAIEESLRQSVGLTLLHAVGPTWDSRAGRSVEQPERWEARLGPSASAEDVARARQAVRLAMLGHGASDERAPRELISAALLELRYATVRREGESDDELATARVYLRGLEPYPLDVARHAIREVGRTARWWPPLADITRAAEALVAKRRAILAALDAWQPRAPRDLGKMGRVVQDWRAIVRAFERDPDYRLCRKVGKDLVRIDEAEARLALGRAEDAFERAGGDLVRLDGPDSREVPDDCRRLLAQLRADEEASARRGRELLRRAAFQPGSAGARAAEAARQRREAKMAEKQAAEAGEA